MTTPTNDETKNNAPAKTPGFVKGLFGLFSSTKPKHGEVINDGNNVSNGQPTNISVQNPRTLFVNNGPDLISGTPMINRHREIAPHQQQTLSLRNGSSMMLNNTTSSVKRKTLTMDSPWVPRRVNDAHSQQFSSLETSGEFQIGVTRREAEGRLEASGTNSMHANGERNVPYVRARPVSTTTTSATAAGYRYKPKTKRYRQGSAQTPSQQTATAMREIMNRFQPNQVLLTHSTINRSTEYNHYTSSGHLFTRRTRLPTIPSNSAVVMTGNKHRIEDEEEAATSSSTTPVTKRQRVTFGDDNKTSAFGSPASVHSTPARSVNEIDEFTPRPNLSFDLLYDNVPLTSVTITKPRDSLPPINADLQPLVVPPKLASITQMQLLLKEGTKSAKQKKSKVVDNTAQVQPPSAKKNRSNPTNAEVQVVSSGWGETFANQKNLWKCSACYTQNKQEFTKCQSCEAPRVQGAVSTSDSAATKGNNSVASPSTSSKVGNPVSSSIGSGGFVFKPVHDNATNDQSASFTPSIGSIVNKGSAIADLETAGHPSSSQVRTKGEIGNNGFTFGVSPPGNGLVTGNEKSYASGSFTFGGMNSISSTTKSVSQVAGSHSFASATNNVSQNAIVEKSQPDQAAKPAGFAFGQPSTLQTKASKQASTPSELVEDNTIVSNVSSLVPFSFGSKREPESSAASKPSFGGFSFASGQDSSKMPISETTKSTLSGPVTISMNDQKQNQINFGFSSGNVDTNSTVSTKSLDESASKSVMSNFQFSAGPVSTFDKPSTESQNSFKLPSLDGKGATPAAAAASPFQFGSSLQTSEGNVPASTDINSFGFGAAPSVPQTVAVTSTAAPAPFSGFGTSTPLVSAQSTTAPSSATPFVFGASTVAPSLAQQSVPVGTSETIRTKQFNSQNDSAFPSLSTESFGRSSMLAPAAMSTTSFGSVPVSAPTLPPLFGNTSSSAFGQPLTPAHSFAPPLTTAFGAQAPPQALNFGAVPSNSATFGSQPSNFGSATQPAPGFFGSQPVPQKAPVLQLGFAPSQQSMGLPAGSFQIGVGGTAKPTNRRILKAKRPSAR